ncbi:MAG TPA: hypothetical protein VG326_17800 [Tepidisphaeraceae bacterium]|nr:hypothetical protein [Tepidisphaeraceae bacterium]
MALTVTDESTSIVILRASDFASGDPYLQWDDPTDIARIPPWKLAALLANPLRLGFDDPVEIVGLRGRTVVGKMDLIVGAAAIDGQVIPVLWTSMLIVPEQFRGTLMGALIVLKMQQMMPTVAACAVSVAALPVYEKLKWMHFRLHRHILLRRSRPVVERYFGEGFPSRVANCAADAGLIALRAATGPFAALLTRGLHCRQAARMDPALDHRIGACDRPACFVRSAAWVNWALDHPSCDDPRDRRGLFIVYDRQERIVGYFLLKSRFYPVATHRGFKNLFLGSLSDWIALEPQALGFTQIVLLASMELARWDVDAIEVCISDGEPAPNLRPWGFVPVGDLHLLVKASARSPLSDPKYAKSSAWRIRPAEGDNFLV